MMLPAHRYAARPVLAAVLAVALAGPRIQPAAAEPLKAVVEVFTSQGCLVCRAADPVIGELAGRPGILALTLPVTYWDYLGWKDTLAQRPFNERQHAYAGLTGVRQAFTPQAVVNGGSSAVGSDRSEIDRILQEIAGQGGLPVPVRGEERGDRIVVDVGGASAPGRAEVWLVPVLRRRPVTVERGESRGRTVTYLNVARGLQRVGAWTGQPAHFEVPRSAVRIGDADSWVVLVQGVSNGKPGKIWGAAKGPGL